MLKLLNHMSLVYFVRETDLSCHKMRSDLCRIKLKLSLVINYSNLFLLMPVSQLPFPCGLLAKHNVPVCRINTFGEKSRMP